MIQVAVPWAESRFTALFEALVIDWLHEASFSAVARQLDLSWAEVDGIQERAVKRGLARRKNAPPKRIGVDETSFQKRHEYVTVVCDLDRKVVLQVTDGHYDGSLDEYYQSLSAEELAGIELVCMDSTSGRRGHVPDADRKIAFDKYHVAQQLGKAVDLVRKSEHRMLQAAGDDTLKKTKYMLTNPENMTTKNLFEPLKHTALKTARAWAIKELAMQLWHYSRRGWAERAWKAWLAWALRCRLTPMRRAAETVRKYLWGILNAITARATNALGEGMNSRIQAIKRMACGYRNRQRFRNAIYFHLGGLDLYPEGVMGTHTKA